MAVQGITKPRPSPVKKQLAKTTELVKAFSDNLRITNGFNQASFQMALEASAQQITASITAIDQRLRTARSSASRRRSTAMVVRALNGWIKQLEPLPLPGRRDRIRRQLIREMNQSQQQLRDQLA